MDSTAPVKDIRAWLARFLNDRGLASPDGRPLFAYKTTAVEYQQLAEHLGNANYLVLETSSYAQAWFLYAAEWWKREYSGGAWAWGPVFQSIQRAPPEYMRIQSMVVKARKDWRLTGDLLGGKKYLGQVAINGGLPLRLFEVAQGDLAKILKAALQKAIGHNLERPQVYAEIADQAESLPRSYRQVMVFDLLTNIVETVQSLRSQHALAGEKDPIRKLGQVHPTWMDQFPLEIDSTSAAFLINGLVREAASTDQQSSRQPFRIIRGLRFSSDGKAILELSLEMPATTSKDAISRALQVDQSTLPAVFQLLLRIGGRDFLVGEAHLREDYVRLLPKRSEIPTDLMKPSVQLLISRYGSTITVTSIPGGDALDDDEPWIFEDSNTLARLIRAGSATVKGASAIALVPDRAILNSEDGTTENLPPTGIPGKLAVRLPHGVTRIVYKTRSYRVRCDMAQTSDDGIYWQGKTLPYPSVPELIFVDRPVLRYELSDRTYTTAPSTEIFQRTPGNARVSLASAGANYGVCRISWEKDDFIQCQIKAVLLPSNASVDFEAGQSALEGVVWLRNWPCQSVISISDNITIFPKRIGLDWRLYVTAKNVVSIQYLQLKILWGGSEQKVTLPFPGEGAIILDADGATLPRKSWLSIGRLLGCKMILMPNQRFSSWRIRLTLNGPSAHAKQMMRTILYGKASEIRLFELADSVKQLISCLTDLDVSVSLEVLNGSTNHAQIFIGRYARQIIPSAPNRRISISNGQRELGPSETEDMELLSIPIQHPECEPLPLRQIFSEGVFTGNWDGNLASEQSGTWIIYPKGKHIIDCRPLAISGSGNVTPSISREEKLRVALGETESDERISLIGSALGEMACLPDHPEWSLVEVMVQRLGQLPLSSMDLWVALSQQPAAMVMAFLHLEGFAEGMAARVPAELPFEWLLTSPQEWTRAFHALKTFYSGNSDDRGFRLLQTDIASKKERILHIQPGLKFILQLAYHFGFESPDQFVRLYQSNTDMILGIWFDTQFEGDKSELQSLMRRSMTDQESWPTELKAKTDRFLKSNAGEEILSRVHFPHDDYKMTTIALPFLVALDVVNGNADFWQNDSSTLFALRRYRDFDLAWFDSAYFVGLAYAYKGYLPK